MVVAAVLTFWLVPMSTLLLGFINGEKETRLAIQIENNTRVYGGQPVASEMKRFLDCVCERRRFMVTQTCEVSFADMKLTLNINSNIFGYRAGRNCSEVQESKDQKIVAITYTRASIQCARSPNAVYIDIRCPYSCLSLLRYDTQYVGSSMSREVFAKNQSCNHQCCKVVFDPQSIKDSGNTSIATTRSTETTSPVLTTLKEIEIKTSNTHSPTTSISMTSLASLTIPSSTLKNPSLGLNSTASAISSASSGLDGKDLIVLIACIVTATLALAAIVISAVACRRHSSRSKSSVMELAVSRVESTCTQPERNVYSSLNPEYCGSTRKYSDFTQYSKELQKKDHDTVEGADHQEEERIYDNIDESDTEYLQPFVASTKI